MVPRFPLIAPSGCSSRRILFVLLCSLASATAVRADLLDEFGALHDRWNETVLDACAEKVDAVTWQELQGATGQFARHLTNPTAQTLWAAESAKTWSAAIASAEAAATLAGGWQARLQHVLALEMLHQQAKGDARRAQDWRALIVLPQHASGVEGALALQKMTRAKAASEGVAELLAKEYVSWQATRVRQKLDALRRTVHEGHANAPLIAARLAEIEGLAVFPAELIAAARAPRTAAVPRIPPIALLESARHAEWSRFSAAYDGWRDLIESALPNLLSKEEVARRERLLLKLLYLVPKEYHNGVRDGQIVVPFEYREAVSFTVQAEQIVNELAASWRTGRAAAYAQNGAQIREGLEKLEEAIKAKVDPDEVDARTEAVVSQLESAFGLTLAKTGVNFVEETVLEVRTALAQSLAAAQAGKWALAESTRLDAYTSFDTAIEPRVLPRAPELGLRAERTFLDGDSSGIGIKAALDRRLRGDELEAAYQRTLEAVNECAALLKVAVSPGTIAFTASTLVMREGMEAVVILAAILAGLRGAENRRPRRYLVMGAWCAVAASVLTFWLSRTLIKSLVHYGEYLEAVISVLAVVILLIVTNWVFHKVYWVQWNARLRQLTRAVESQGSRRWEWLGLIGVGFLTIYREGFETSLFLQSLILEGGVRPVSIGFLIGLGFVGTVGTAVFLIGAKLPYRKLLVITGVLVVSIMVTFIGSTVRLFQTVGWMPIHPIPWLDIPSWAGLWFGLYPSWEGMLIPPLGLAYVAAAWLWTKWRSRRNPPPQGAPVIAREPELAKIS